MNMSEHVTHLYNEIKEEMRKPEAERNRELIGYWQAEIDKIIRLTSSSTSAGKFIAKSHSISLNKI
jgi:hypothetical protein